MRSPDELWLWTMRPRIGMVSLRTFRKSSGRPEFLMALMPRSERARLMDLVKFRGVVEGSLRSTRYRVSEKFGDKIISDGEDKAKVYDSFYN